MGGLSIEREDRSEFLNSIKCPAENAELEPALKLKLNKYRERADAPASFCQSSHWEWRHCLLNPDTIVDMPKEVLETTKTFKVEMEAIEDGFLYPPTADEAHKHY